MNLKNLEKIMQLMQQYGMHRVSVADAETNIKISRHSETGVHAGQSVQADFFTHELGGSEVGETVAAAAVAQQQSRVVESPTPARSAQIKEIKSPFVGTYYSASSPGADPFVHIGKKVTKGEVLCIIEAMKLMNEIEAERDGTIVDILIANEEPVEYDQSLFLIE